MVKRTDNKDDVIIVDGDVIEEAPEARELPIEDPPDRSIEHIMELINQGYKPIEVSKILGCSKALIYNKAKSYGYNILQPPRPKKPKKKRDPNWGKGTKNTSNCPPAQLIDINKSNVRIDQKTNTAVLLNNTNKDIVARIGDEHVSQFVAYHMELMRMRQGVDKKNVEDLYARFWNYLSYCVEHGILPNNMSAYYAIGVARQDISMWRKGIRGTPAHQQFAEDITGFFASVHEQAPTEGLMNPISSIFWQKAHDNLSDQPKPEETSEDPLGDKRSAEDIASRYAGLLPDDN